MTMKQGLINPGGKQADRTLVYIGAYSSGTGTGIYIFEMNRATGKLTPLFEPVKIQNPSYLILDRTKRFLYCVMETTEYSDNIKGGGVAAFSIRDDGSLKLINQQPTHGDDPCYLCVDRENRCLLTANYNGGSLTIFPLDSDGSIKPAYSRITHAGNGPVRDRQNSPHVHFTGFTDDEKYFFAVDLGIDQVKFYRRNSLDGLIVPEEGMTIPCRPGSGPRHLVFQNHYAYIVNELSSDIGVFSLENGLCIPKQYISTVPKDYKGPNAPAAIKLSKDGRLLLVSNRGHDSISVFRIKEDHLLEWVLCVPSGSSGPRDFCIDPEEKFILVANETGNRVDVLQIDRGAGTIEPTGHTVSLYRPSCIIFP